MGTETFDVVGKLAPRANLIVMIQRRNGEQVEVPVTCRLDTAEEVSIYEAGGVLQTFAQDFVAEGTPSPQPPPRTGRRSSESPLPVAGEG